jgi:hypothetical protein
MKKGQTTIFIIIAIVAVAAIVGVTLLTQSSSKSNIENAFANLGISEQASVVENSIINCLKESAKDSLDIIGLQGGLYERPEKLEDFGFIFIPYYYYQGEYYQPSKTKIEEQINKMLNEILPFCIDNLYIDNDFTLKQKDTNSNIRIKSNEVSFMTDLTISISKDQTTTEFQLISHPITIQSKLNEIIEVSTFITDSHKDDPDLICLSCVADMAEERNLYVEFTDFENVNPTTLVIITENSTSEEVYIFEFLNGYT